MSDVDQMKNSSETLPTEEASASHNGRAPIEGMSPAAAPDPASIEPVLPPSEAPAEKINTPLSDDMSPPAVASGEATVMQPSEDDQVVTPSSDEFLDQLLKSAQPPSAETTQIEPIVPGAADSSIPPPSEPPSTNPALAAPLSSETPLELPPTVPAQAASPAGEEVPPTQFPSDHEQIDLRGLNNELANREVSSAPPKKSGSAVWPIVIIVLLIGGALAAYFLVINKPEDLATSPTGTDVSLLAPSTASPIESPVVAATGDTQRKADLTNIQKALEQYYAAGKKYPVSATESKTEDADAALKILVPQYISSLPTDPAAVSLSATTQALKSYTYKSADGSTYELSAIFDAAPSGISKVEQVADGYKVVLTPGDSFEATTTEAASSSTPVSTASAPAVSSDSLATGL